MFYHPSQKNNESLIARLNVIHKNLEYFKDGVTLKYIVIYVITRVLNYLYLTKAINNAVINYI